MLKFLFFTLLLANAGLYCYEQGYLETWLPKGHEPERLARQVRPETIRQLPAGSDAKSEPKPASTPVGGADTGAAGESADRSGKADDLQPLNAGTSAVCLEFAPLDDLPARRLVAAIQGLKLGKVSSHSVSDDVRHFVYIPPLGSKDAADRKAGELKRLGINDFFVIQDNGDMHFGISLGVFKTEEAARAHLAELTRKGVRSARLGSRTGGTVHTVVAWNGTNAMATTITERVKTDFPKLDHHECSVSPEATTTSVAASTAVAAQAARPAAPPPDKSPALTPAQTTAAELSAARHALATGAQQARDKPH